jgi:hypothetical protein
MLGNWGTGSSQNLAHLSVMNARFTSNSPPRYAQYELQLLRSGELESEAHEPGTREPLTIVTGSVTIRSANDSLSVVTREIARYGG